MKYFLRSRSISMKVLDRTGIELATSGSAVRLASVARYVTDCATWPDTLLTQQPLILKWTGPTDKTAKFHLAVLKK